MHVVSWNVAGLSTTLSRIEKDYGGASLRERQQQQQQATTHADNANTKQKPASTSSSSSSGSGTSSASQTKTTTSNTSKSHAFEYYLHRHDIDVLCVQEHKIPHRQLSSRSEPHLCSTVPGYQSFWSCCVDHTKKGLNGVVTYAKTGMVQSANANIFNDPNLDNQGRCVVTDHGTFVIFNVYVPAGGGQPLSYKMKFLNALRRAMWRQREELGRKVMLVGDLNIAHTPLDIFWKFRDVHVDKILDDVQMFESRGGGGGGGRERPQLLLPQWKMDVARHWSKIQTALGTKKVVPKQTTNSATGEKFDKFTLTVTVGSNEAADVVHLGKAEPTEEAAASYYNLEEQTYYDVDDKEEKMAREANVISVEGLAELMSKIAGVEWSISTQRRIVSVDGGDGNDDVYHNSPSKQWLNKIIYKDGMVDAFRSIYPNARNRFTCWHQYTNRRYDNEGIRLDYTLLDKDLAQFVRRGAPLRCCNLPPNEDPLGEEAALHAATASGGYKGASFEGGGISDATQDTLDRQFGPLHTGIVYTPPSYSDHVAVSLLLDDGIRHRSGDLTLDESDRATIKAQPHRAQPSIASFFGSSSKPSSSNRGSSSGSSSSNTGNNMPSKSSSTAGGTRSSTSLKVSNNLSVSSKTSVAAASSTKLVIRNKITSFVTSTSTTDGSNKSKNGSIGSKKRGSRAFFSTASSKAARSRKQTKPAGATERGSRNKGLHQFFKPR